MLFAHEMACLGGAFDPVMAGLRAYWDMDHGVVASTNITSVRDRVGYYAALDMLPVNATTAPAAWRNGRKAFTPTGTMGLRATVGGGGYGLTSPYFLVYVGQWPAQDSLYHIAAKSDASAAAPLFIDSAQRTLATSMGGTDRQWGYAAGRAGKAFVAVAAMNGASSVLYIRTEGFSELTLLPLDGAPGTNTGTNAWTWGSDTGFSQYWNAPLAGLGIGVGTPSAGQISYILNSLSSDYAIVGNDAFNPLDWGYYWDMDTNVSLGGGSTIVTVGNQGAKGTANLTPYVNAPVTSVWRNSLRAALMTDVGGMKALQPSATNLPTQFTQLLVGEFPPTDANYHHVGSYGGAGGLWPLVRNPSGSLFAESAGTPGVNLYSPTFTPAGGIPFVALVTSGKATQTLNVWAHGLAKYSGSVTMSVFAASNMQSFGCKYSAGSGADTWKSYNAGIGTVPWWLSSGETTRTLQKLCDRYAIVPL